MNEIIFYNGFNLLVDIIIALSVGLSVYALRNRKAYIDGYTDGVNDVRHAYLSKHGIR
jgi:hypothetical protein